MKILFDRGTPEPLRRELGQHEVSTAHEMGWSNLKNGELIAAAEQRFDVFVTTDQHLKHEQNLSGCRLAIIVLMTTSWPRIQKEAHRVVEAINHAQPGDLVEVTFSKPR